MIISKYAHFIDISTGINITVVVYNCIGLCCWILCLGENTPPPLPLVVMCMLEVSRYSDDLV